MFSKSKTFIQYYTIAHRRGIPIYLFSLFSMLSLLTFSRINAKNYPFSQVKSKFWEPCLCKIFNNFHI